MALPDNRMRFPAPKIDFETEVGTTGQDHDNYPAPGQARYDWLRMSLISLLANQSSDSEPTQYREGTFWFDLNGPELKIRLNNAWVPASDSLMLGTTTLTAWYEGIQANIAAAAPTITFSGTAYSNSLTLIEMPSTITELVDPIRNKAFVYINGLLQDPRSTLLSGPTIVLTDGVELNIGDKYTVELKNVSHFHEPNVNLS